MARRRLHPLGPILLLAAGLMSIGIAEDYRLKHEDNNQLYTTFARSHLALGLRVTKGQDTFYSPRSGRTTFYGHHPPGAALLLAAVFELTGHDEPWVVRSVAICFQLASLVLLFDLVQRLGGRELAVVTSLVMAILPMGAFYGRMVNHEILALPFVILLVGSYLGYLESSRPRQGWLLAGSLIGGACFGWVIFLAAAACGIHALTVRRTASRRATTAFWLLLSLSAAAFVAIVAHIAWVFDGNLTDLRSALIARVAGDREYTVLTWSWRLLGFNRRLLSATGTVCSVWLLWKCSRRWLRKQRGAAIEEAGGLFLAGGLLYIAAFPGGAWPHHYWQLPLLPGVAIAIALALDRLKERGEARASAGRRVLVTLMVAEILATSAWSLWVRHTREEPYAVETVEMLRREFL